MLTTLTTAAAGAAIKAAITEVASQVKKTLDAPERLVQKAIGTLELGKRVYQIINVKTLWSIEKEISLFEFYYPSRIIFPGEEKARECTDTSFIKEANFAIQGTAGQGKSIFLRHLYGMLAFSVEEHKKIPLFVELRRVTSNKSLTDLISAEIERIGLPKPIEFGDAYFESGRFILLLDGFDELAFDLISTTCDDLERLATRFPLLRVIATSRPDAAIQRSAHFRVLRLDTLTSQDHLPFLEKICVTKAQALEIHRAITSNIHGIGSLLVTPLLMTLLVLLYRAQSSVPTSMSRFYEQLFDVLFLKHDQTKPGFQRSKFTNLDEVTLKKLFEAFSFSTQIAGKQILTLTEFETHLQEASALTEIKVSTTAFRKELVKTACLLVEEGREVSFIHKSVAEFYAASFVQKSAASFGEDFYTQLHEGAYSAWQGELSFLKEIDRYRYVRYFSLPQIQKALGRLRDSRKPEQIDSKVIEKMTSPLQIAYGINDKGEFSTFSISNFGEDLTDTIHENEIFMELIRIILLGGGAYQSAEFPKWDKKNRKTIAERGLDKKHKPISFAELNKLSNNVLLQRIKEKGAELIDEFCKREQIARSELALEENKASLEPKLRLKPIKHL